MGITNPGEEYFKNGGWGWDGSQWCKLPLVWGYSDCYAELLTEDNAVAGNNYLAGTTVPAGEVWVVTCFSMWNANTVTLATSGGIYDGATTISVHSELSPAAGETVEWNGFICLKEGDRMRASFFTCALNDNIRATFLGYKMAVA